MDASKPAHARGCVAPAECHRAWDEAAAIQINRAVTLDHDIKLSGHRWSPLARERWGIGTAYLSLALGQSRRGRAQKTTIVAPIPDDSRGDAEAQRAFTTKAAKGTKNRWNENGRESAPRRDADV